MSGKEAEAVKILDNAITKAQNEGKCHEAYETEMLLVEMLIYKVLYYLVLLQLRKRTDTLLRRQRPTHMIIYMIFFDLLPSCRVILRRRLNANA